MGWAAGGAAGQRVRRGRKNCRRWDAKPHLKYPCTGVEREPLRRYRHHRVDTHTRQLLNSCAILRFLRPRCFPPFTSQTLSLARADSAAGTATRGPFSSVLLHVIGKYKNYYYYYQDCWSTARSLPILHCPSEEEETEDHRLPLFRPSSLSLALSPSRRLLLLIRSRLVVLAARRPLCCWWLRSNESPSGRHHADGLLLHWCVGPYKQRRRINTWANAKGRSGTCVVLRCC